MTGERESVSRGQGRPRVPSSSRRAVAVCFFILGMHAMLSQVLLLREFLAVFYGNELCIGMIFGAWFLWISAGAFAGSRAWSGENARIEWLAILVLAFSVALPAEVLCVRYLRSFLGVTDGLPVPFPSMVCSTAAIVFPVSFLVGFVFPLGVALSGRSGDGIGRLYAAEALGSVFAGVLFTFVFVRLFGNLRVGLLAGILAAGCGACLSLSCGRRVRVVSAIVFLGGIVFTSPPVFDIVEGHSLRTRFSTVNSKMRLVASEDSAYQNLALGGLEDQYSLFGNSQLQFSFPDEYGVAQYVHPVMVEHPDPRDVLIVGGGSSGALREMLLHGVSSVDYVELDSGIVDIVRKKTEVIPEGGAVKFFPGDGRAYIRETGKKYDLIMLDLPEPATAMVNRFYTREFFEEARRALKTGGVLGTQVTSGVNYMGQEVGRHSASVYRTLASVFPFVVVTPGEENQFFASSSPGTVTLDPGILARRFRERGIESGEFDYPEERFETLYPADRVEFVKEKLGSFKVALNTDLRPVTYFLNMLLWDRAYGARLGSFFGAVEKLKLYWLIVAAAGIFLIKLVIDRLRGSSPGAMLKSGAVTAITTTGFYGMASEMVLLFAYQNAFGCIYERVGIVIACFMAGIFAGAASSRRYVRKGASATLLISELALVLHAVVVYTVLVAHSRGMLFLRTDWVWEAVIFLLVGSAGFMTGFEFPLSGSVFMAGGGNAARGGGVIDSADHAGALLGATVAGTCLIPVLGITECCLLAAAVKAGSSLVYGVGWCSQRVLGKPG